MAAEQQTREALKQDQAEVDNCQGTREDEDQGFREKGGRCPSILFGKVKNKFLGQALKGDEAQEEDKDRLITSKPRPEVEEIWKDTVL